MKLRNVSLLLSLLVGVVGMALSSRAVPTDIQLPGTQPLEAGNIEHPSNCTGCHGHSNKRTEIAHNWRGGMMTNAGRDPIFWATMAVGEQDFPGSGDLCIRCHSTMGWLNGHALPTDGSGLTEEDTEGVDCDTCHRMTNPDFSEHLGEMNSPYIANDRGNPPKGYYGSGMLSIRSGNEKLGPYNNAQAHHPADSSNFHRSPEFCGSCHDVSNPAVGDLAIGNGKQATADAVIFSGVPGSPVAGKAAFNNFPHKYGIAERTFSEFKAGQLGSTLVSNYNALPGDLKAGAIAIARDNALAANPQGNYQDGTPRKFSCQTCHMPPVTGEGAITNNIMTRTDLAVHDMTGGNTVAPDLLLYQNANGTLRLGGGMNIEQIEATLDAKERARQELRRAASMQISGNTLRVINLTGHKLITGYPEGRRMWLNIKWFNGRGVLIREDGKYGPITAVVNGLPTVVETIQNPNDPNTKIYEVKMGITREWAAQLVALGYSGSLPVSYDRVSGNPTLTLGALASAPAGSAAESFRFLLSNTVIADNRIPPYGMAYEAARQRNVLPVPATQYGNPGPAGTYQYWDQFTLNPPVGASYATVDLLYQTISWEYLQFLMLANNGSSAFLGSEGVNLYSAWKNTGMGKPEKMASAQWGVGKVAPKRGLLAPVNLAGTALTGAVRLNWTRTKDTISGFLILDYQAGKTYVKGTAAPTASTYTVPDLYSDYSFTYVVAAWRDQNGNGVYDPDLDLIGANSNKVTVKTN